MEAMQSKGISGKMMEEERMEMERFRTRNIELETRLRHMENMMENKEKDSLRVSRNFWPCKWQIYLGMALKGDERRDSTTPTCAHT